MKRQIFTICIAVLGMVLCAPSVLASNVYAVNGVSVDVTASNALTARTKAFEAAQAKAFDALVKQMLAEKKITQSKKPSLKLISRMIQDFEITKEQLSDVRYLGTYNFRFNQASVNQYFNISAQMPTYTNTGSGSVVVLPFFQGARDTWLWSPKNFWMRAWTRNNQIRGALPLRVPVGDLDDIQDIKDHDLFDYDQGKLDRMLARYGSSEAILVVGSASTDFLAVANDADIARGKFTAHIYRTDRRGPEYVSNVVVEARAPETRAQMLKRAVKKVRVTLQRGWKTKTATTAHASLNKLVAVTQFSSLKEWAQMQKTLLRLTGVDGVNVQSLSPSRAQVELVYRGTEERLRMTLDQSRLALNDAGGGVYSLSFR